MNANGIKWPNTYQNSVKYYNQPEGHRTYVGKKVDKT